jgi:DNA repair exonuclease SbcCD nuclease subunit
MLKICHFADLHASAKTKEEAVKALKFIWEECRDRGVSAIINSGDTWDGPVTLSSGSPANEVLELFQYCPSPLYVISGTPSHDISGSLDFIDKLYFIGRGYKPYVIKEPESWEIVKTPDKEILGKLVPGYIYPGPDLDPGELLSCGHMSFLPAPTKSFLAKDLDGSPEQINERIRERLRDILAGFGLKAKDSPRPHILVGHITVSGSETSTGQTMLGGDIQVSVADLALADADYIALGHIHKAQQPNLPMHISYAGSPYHLNFGELEPKGFKIATFDDDGRLADVEFIETPSRPRVVIDVHVIDGKLKWSQGIYLKADTRVRIHAPAHELTDAVVNEVENFCIGSGIHSLKIEKIPIAETRIRAAELTGAKTLRDKLIEYGRIKEIEVAESILTKADRLEATEQEVIA